MNDNNSSTHVYGNIKSLIPTGEDVDNAFKHMELMRDKRQMEKMMLMEKNPKLYMVKEYALLLFTLMIGIIALILAVTAFIKILSGFLYLIGTIILFLFMGFIWLKAGNRSDDEQDE